MPLRPGAVRLSSGANWHTPTVLTGDIHNGKWRHCESAPAATAAAGLEVKVSPDQALSLLLVTESGRASKWCQAVERAMNAPAALQ